MHVHRCRNLPAPEHVQMHFVFVVIGLPCHKKFDHRCYCGSPIPSSVQSRPFWGRYSYDTGSMTEEGTHDDYNATMLLIG
jgi:hypothetical protein